MHRPAATIALGMGSVFDWIDDRVFLLPPVAFLALPMMLVGGRFLAMRGERSGMEASGRWARDEALGRADRRKSYLGHA